MVGTEQPHFKLKDDENLMVDTSSNALVRHDQMLLSPSSSSHSSDYSDNASTSASHVNDQKAIKNFEDNSETTSGIDRLDR